MTALNPHTRSVTLATLVFAVVTAAIVGLYKQESPLGGATRVNSFVVLPRAAEVTCDAIRQKDGNFAKVHLVIDGMDSGIAGAGCSDSPPTVSFEFRHAKPNGLTPQQDETVWGRILGRPLETLRGPRDLRYDVQWVSEGQPIKHLADPKSPAVLHLGVFDWWAPAVLMLVLYVWFMIGWLGYKTSLLRDPAPEGTPMRQRTYSLARTQMAWWFAIIFSSLVFLWLVTGETPSLSGQALGLMGLAGATTMAATGVAGGRTFTDGVKGEFFIDLLSDPNGVAIHRFQMLAVTMALGLMFLFAVATTLTMPQFDGSLLTLMGLSAGTYVALKIPEVRASASDNDPKNAYTPTS